jgi:hypothetical protein
MPTLVDPAIAALFVEAGGCYWNLPGVDPWDEARDARKYTGPHPVVAHPPCQRWGRFWHGSTRKPHQFKLGDDSGCFLAALQAVEDFGGVIEHPADSHAWKHFGITKPTRDGGWTANIEWYEREIRRQGLSKEAAQLVRRTAIHNATEWSCCVYQGKYGHFSGKPTWLFVSGLSRSQLPNMRWGKTEQRIHPRALELHGYEKARRIGMMAMVGGKDKTRIRNATPPEFRDVLINIARLARKD